MAGSFAWTILPPALQKIDQMSGGDWLTKQMAVSLLLRSQSQRVRLVWWEVGQSGPGKSLADQPFEKKWGFAVGFRRSLVITLIASERASNSEAGEPRRGIWQAVLTVPSTFDEDRNK